MKIALLTGTRGRPQNMTRLASSAIKTASKPETIETIYYIDNDDNASIRRLKELRGYYKEQIKGIVGPRIVMSDMTNECYKKTDANIVMYAGDDLIFRTLGWDEMVRAEFLHFPDSILLVGGDDGYNKDIITHGFLSRKWVDTVGYVVPWGFSGDYCDAWVTDIADILGRRRCLPNMLIEHMHWAAKDSLGKPKAVMDQTNKEKNQRCYSGKEPVNVKFANGRPQRISDANKLLKLMKGTS